jgi:hypothetical protein
VEKAKAPEEPDASILKESFSPLQTPSLIRLKIIFILTKIRKETRTQ